MAKKTAKKPAAKAAKTTKAAKKKAPAKKRAHPVEIKLDAAEKKAFELAHDSDEVCEELELAVTAAVSTAVRDVFKEHRVALTVAQSEKVALVLFGD